MGVGILLAGATGLAAAGKIAGGISANNQAKRESGMLNDQANVAESEAALEASRRAADVRQFAAKQKLQFLKNGVSLEGSPLFVLEDTLTSGQQEVDSIMNAGAAKGRYFRDKAAITRSSGKASLLAGFTGAGSSLLLGGSLLGGAGSPATASFGSNFARDTMASRM